MIKVSVDFPAYTGDTERDIQNIFDYLYKLERELRYEISKRDTKIKELEEIINGR